MELLTFIILIYIIKSIHFFVFLYSREKEGYCSPPTSVHSNGICPLKVAYGEGCYAPVAHVQHGPQRSVDQMHRNHNFIGSDAVQLGARHGVNSNERRH